MVNIALEEERVKNKSKVIKDMSEILSFPPLRTNQFNADGDDRFRSKL